MSWISTNNLRRFADKLFHGNLSFGGSVTHNGATTFNGGVKVNTTKAEFAAPVSFTGTTTYKGNEIATVNNISGIASATIKTNLASTSAASLGSGGNLTPGVTGILSVANGGTGTDSLANVTVGKASTLVGDAGLWNYLHRLGEDPTLPTTNHELNALGVFMSLFTQKDKIANQPTQYGQLINLPADKGNESAQLWIEQASGRMYHRGGNGSIAINGTLFKRFLDTDDLSAAGVVAGDVSNANAWWVKLGGAVPLIIQGVTVVMTGDWDTVKLPISANNYFAIASPVTPTTNHFGGGADVPVSVQSIRANSIIIALPGGGNRWKASILIIGTV